MLEILTTPAQTIPINSIDWTVFAQMQEQFLKTQNQANDSTNQRDSKIDAILEMLVQDKKLSSSPKIEEMLDLLVQQKKKDLKPRQLRMPDLIIQEFHGKIKEYKSFKDMFHLATNNLDLSETQPN